MAPVKALKDQIQLKQPPPAIPADAIEVGHGPPLAPKRYA
jgi:hypothetical protein